jgi:hypothetical protein
LAQLVITIPDAVQGRVTDALALSNGWTAASPLTKSQFAQRVVRDFVRATTIDYEANAAASAAASTARATASTDIVLS